MTYKYEESLKNRLLNLELDDYVEVIQLEKEYEELKEVFAKAKSFDKLVEFYPQKEEIPSDEFFDLMGYIIEGCEVDGV